jgi:hypothetical protein
VKAVTKDHAARPNSGMDAVKAVKVIAIKAFLRRAIIGSGDCFGFSKSPLVKSFNVYFIGPFLEYPGA